MTQPSLAALVATQRLIICVGSGGVGKTTVAASIGLRAAREGRRVMVLTIDPAKRLANALGLSRFGNDETRIDVPGAKGELWAMMLDSRHAFDALIGRIATDPANRARILENHVYRNVADSIAGSQEYMATEKLYDVVSSGRYDLVVLDTPPVKNALDFLEAPGRLARFLDRRIMKWFLQPYDEKKVFGRLSMGTSAVVFRLLGFIFGPEFLKDLTDFFVEFRDLYDGFRERHEAVIEMFHDAGTAFLVVCAPHNPSVEVAHFFLHELRGRRLPGRGVIVNQVHRTCGRMLDADTLLGSSARELSEDLAPHTASRLLARLGAAHRRLRELSVLEDEHIRSIREALSRDQQIWEVRRFEHQVHDIAALDHVGLELFGPLC